MKLALLFLMLAGAALAGPIDEAPDFERLVSAIYRAEGGASASSPFGILSIKVTSKAQARRICLTTCRNNWRRWIEAGKPGGYLEFLADRYCPKSVDHQGNANWKRNVARFYQTTG